MGCNSQSSYECKLVQLLRRATCHWLPWYAPLTARPLEPFTHAQVCAKEVHKGILLQHCVKTKPQNLPKYPLIKEWAKVPLSHDIEYFSSVKGRQGRCTMFYYQIPNIKYSPYTYTHTSNHHHHYHLPGRAHQAQERALAPPRCIINVSCTKLSQATCTEGSGETERLGARRSF